MTQEHPIAPPSEDHVLKWSDEWFEAKVKHMTREKHLCMQAARWGADKELEACCEWLKVKEWIHPEFSDELRAARRPKPPSLKEQALEALYQIESEFPAGSFGKTIRRALESLPD